MCPVVQNLIRKRSAAGFRKNMAGSRSFSRSIIERACDDRASKRVEFFGSLQPPHEAVLDQAVGAFDDAIGRCHVPFQKASNQHRPTTVGSTAVSCPAARFCDARAGPRK